MTVASVLEWQRWAIQFAALNGHAVPATRYLGWYGWSWKLAFPPGTGFPQELSMGMLTGLLTGGIFAYLVRGRVQALRLATIGFWLLFAAVFFVRSVFFLHFDPRWHGNSLFVVRMLLLNFAIREFVCAGSFWLGTYLPSLNRSSWRQVSH